MKRVLKHIVGATMLLVCLLCAERVSAQHYIGFRGGYGYGTIRFYPEYAVTPVWGMYTGGISWKWYNEVKVFGCIGADLEFQQRAFKRYYGNKTDSTIYYKRSVNTIMLPFYWQPHLYFFRRHVRVSLCAGVTFSYNFGPSHWEMGTKRDGVTNSGSYEYQTARDCKIGYGLVGGGGIEYLAGRVSFNIDARYYVGYSDLLRNRTKYSQNPVRSELDNLFVNFGIYFRLGKGGIKEPPLNLHDPVKRAARKADRGNFTDIKVIE